MKTLNTTLVLATLLSTTTVFGQAMLTSNCQISPKIKMPGGSSFYMSRDCKTAYVLPPETGEITLEGITESATLQRCGELDDVLKNLRTISKKLTSSELVSESQEEEEAPETYNPYRPLPTGRRLVPERTNPSNKLTEEEVKQLLLAKKDLAEKIMKDFGQTSGVSVQLNYSTNYGELVQKVRDLNKSTGVTFMQLPLKKTKVHFSSPNMSSQQYPMVISSTFPTSQDETMTGSISGSVELSLLGACPLRDKFNNRISRIMNSRKFSSFLNAHLVYEYELLSTIRYDAVLNRGGLAKQIREASTRGGFFTSKTVSKFITTSKSESWFKYQAYCDESRGCEELHNVNILDIKKRLMDEVISNIILLKHDYPLIPLESGTPGKNGAATASDELKKCTHMYCQIAAGVLDVANATFGSTSKADQYINKQDHEAMESYHAEKAFSYQGSMGFAPKG